MPGDGVEREGRSGGNQLQTTALGLLFTGRRSIQNYLEMLFISLFPKLCSLHGKLKMAIVFPVAENYGQMGVEGLDK